jgi:hypothetical protein
MTTARIVSIVSVVALAGLIVSSVQQRPVAGLHKVPLGLSGGVPATLYYQDPVGAPPDARPGMERLGSGGQLRAGVVVAHGFAGDRNTMEGLSESLALAGYVVVSLDMSGHGRSCAIRWCQPSPPRINWWGTYRRALIFAQQPRHRAGQNHGVGPFDGRTPPTRVTPA